MRRIVYISGTRADFGLMRRALLAVAATPGLALSVIVTGMHLSREHGHTVDEVAASGLSILAQVPVPLTPANGATMARGIGAMTGAFTGILEQERPDMVLLLGDRGEMLAGAIAAAHLNIPVAHIHGGERSGTIDEPVRHAVSKLAHLHLVATEEAAERLTRMGETNIVVTGAPGIDGLTGAPVDREATMRAYGFDPARRFALLAYHPVLQEAERGAEDLAMLLSVLSESGCQTLALMPNADAGSDAMRPVLAAAASADVAVRTHLDRPAFIAAMAAADVMVGNSSAGIIEAASFGTPVLNVGSRQNLRERNANVRDVPADREAVAAALAEVLEQGRFAPVNVYGDGQASARIARALRDVELGPALTAKINAY